MNRLQINFQLQELDKIAPWGEEGALSLHWFGLTDGYLWIDVGNQTIYEYNEEARSYFGSDIKYNDYQISRFLEDFFHTFSYVGESIPKELYDVIENFDSQMDIWQEAHVEDEDELYEKFYDEEYCELGQWFWKRSFDSGHLVGGPYIGCFRCEDKIKIIWESTYKLDNGKSIWTAPKGCFEMRYEEFVLEITEFLNLFFKAMDRQVENAQKMEWKDISLDIDRLVKEHKERKTGFYNKLTFLEKTPTNTEWSKIKKLYIKMKEEIT